MPSSKNVVKTNYLSHDPSKRSQYFAITDHYLQQHFRLKISYASKHFTCDLKKTMCTKPKTITEADRVSYGDFNHQYQCEANYFRNYTESSLLIEKCLVKQRKLSNLGHLGNRSSRIFSGRFIRDFVTEFCWAVKRKSTKNTIFFNFSNRQFQMLVHSSQSALLLHLFSSLYYIRFLHKRLNYRPSANFARFNNEFHNNWTEVILLNYIILTEFKFLDIKLLKKGNDKKNYVWKVLCTCM